MTIFQVLTNKLMNGYTYHHFRELYDVLIKIKSVDHQDLLNNDFNILKNNHDIRLQVLDLFHKNQYRNVNFFNILMKEDQELFLWNSHRVMKILIDSNYTYRITLYHK